MSLDTVLSNLEPAEARALARLIDVWQRKQYRNRVRSTYYSGKNALVDLGISIPPQMKNIETQLGWPAKGVTVLADRCNFESFVMPGVDQDPLGVTELLGANHFGIELPQAITSSLIHSVAFLTVTHGDVEAGEPDVLILAKDATSAAGIWDPRRRSLASGLSVSDVDEAGNITGAALYLPGRVVEFRALGGGAWSIDRIETGMSRVLMEPLIYRPELTRPFGHSRISRPVMALTDSAIRTVLRSEVSAEFFSAPQRYLLGADEGAFTDSSGKPLPKWQAVLGRFLAIGRDENGDMPQVGQFQAQSMQPHSDQLQTWAKLFAAEVSIPVDELGVVQDNPASAEAIARSKETLVITAKAATTGWGESLTRVIQSAIMLRDGLSEVSADMLRLEPKWSNPATPSIVSAADAVVKQVAAVPWLAESTVVLEALGYDQLTISRLLADKRRAEGGARLDAILAGPASATGAQPEAAPPASERDPGAMKASFEALGVAVRAGVDPDDAAQRLGLSGVRFTGAVPVSLRMPEGEAAGLEEK